MIVARLTVTEDHSMAMGKRKQERQQELWIAASTKVLPNV